MTETEFDERLKREFERGRADAFATMLRVCDGVVEHYLGAASGIEARHYSRAIARRIMKAWGDADAVAALELRHVSPNDDTFAAPEAAA